MANKLQEKSMEMIQEEEVIRLARELVQIPSENPPGRLAEITDYVGNYLSEAGLDYEIVKKEEGWPVILSTIEGEQGGKHLVLNGHLDVVPAGEAEKWEFPPYGGQIEDGYLLGRGTSDMKGGVAGLLAAFRAASRLSGFKGKITLMLVPDEESGGRLGTGWILEEKEFEADGCLIAEPSKKDPTVGQKGSCWIKVTTSGTPGHGSLSPVSGDNAILKMNRALEVIYRIWDKEWEIPSEVEQLMADSKAYIREEQQVEDIERILDHVTVNAGVIQGGDKVNKIPDHCQCQVDMRTPIGVTTDEVFDWLRNELREAGVEAGIEPLDKTSEANYTLPTEEIVRSVLRTAKMITGRESKATLQWASSDARYFRSRGIPTIQYGPAELEGIHSYNERVKVDELVQYARAYGAIIYDFLS